MKKNDAMGYVAYALMLVIAVLVALLVLRPIFGNSEYVAAAPMPGILVVILAILAGVVLNGLLLELGHLAGAKMGHYRILSWVCLGLGYKVKDGKKKFFAGSFDGITGETTVVPEDVKKSNPRHMIYMPLLFFFVEVVALVIFVVFAQLRVNASETVWIWWKLFALVMLTIGGMVYLYDIFPAALDAKNDGYLLTILTNPTNTLAYNQMLVAQERLAEGLPAENTPVYDSVTDFTAKINDLSLYEKLAAKDYDGALAIVEKTLACKDKVSGFVYSIAIAQKTAIILMTKPLAESKAFFIALPLGDKKSIAALESAPAVRAYILASGLVEDSLSETEAALDHADAALKHTSSDKRPTELALLHEAVNKVKAAHADWDLSSYDPLLKEDEKPAPKKDEK